MRGSGSRSVQRTPFQKKFPPGLTLVGSGLSIYEETSWTATYRQSWGLPGYGRGDRFHHPFVRAAALRARRNMPRAVLRRANSWWRWCASKTSCPSYEVLRRSFAGVNSRTCATAHCSPSASKFLRVSIRLRRRCARYWLRWPLCSDEAATSHVR